MFESNCYNEYFLVIRYKEFVSIGDEDSRYPVVANKAVEYEAA